MKAKPDAQMSNVNGTFMMADATMKKEEKEGETFAPNQSKQIQVMLLSNLTHSGT